MKEIMVKVAGSRRKKLWEVERYHCSIIGTCLSRNDLRKIARRQEFHLPADLTDYQLHSSLVNLAAIKGPESRTLQRMLDRKFRRAVNRFCKVKTEGGVRELWRQHVAKGALAGPYWALLSHPSTTAELAAEAHGEIHMIGHDLTTNYQQLAGEIDSLRDKNLVAEKALAEEKRKFRKVQSALEETRLDHNQLLAYCDKLQRENENLRLAVLKLEATPIAAGAQADSMQLQRLREDNALLCGQVDMLAEELQETRDLAELNEMSIRELGRANSQLLHEKRILEQEVYSLETNLMEKLFSSYECDNCADKDTESCPGPGLCGKTVLYVGGLHKMVPHYKQLVEKYGGVFIHHDGGREASRAILPKMLHSADAVLCPIDCVSHDACKNVKKICKRYQKPFVMMRSSGLSSLAKGLSDIMVVQ